MHPANDPDAVACEKTTEIARYYTFLHLYNGQ